MKKSKLILSFIFLYNICNACDCDFLPSLSQKEVDKYEYIGNVRVLEIVSFRGVEDKEAETRFPYYKIIVEEITNYKGTFPKEIIVRGGHPTINQWTSCDLDIDEKDEWLVYVTTFNKYPWIDYCGRTKEYKNHKGLSFSHSEALKEMNWLDSFFHKDQTKKKSSTVR